MRKWDMEAIAIYAQNMCIQELADKFGVKYQNMATYLSKHKIPHQQLDTSGKNSVHYKHGECRSRLYSVYCEIKNRCYNKRDKSYKWYGAKGIKVCEKWSDYILFQRWAYAHGYKEGMSLDRIDNTKDYSPDNCRWVNAKVQANNKSNNHYLTYKGRTQTLIQWSEELGINYDTLKSRINRSHWSVEKAFETRVK